MIDPARQHLSGLPQLRFPLRSNARNLRAQAIDRLHRLLIQRLQALFNRRDWAPNKISRNWWSSSAGEGGTASADRVPCEYLAWIVCLFLPGLIIGKVGGVSTAATSSSGWNGFAK